MTNTQKKLTEVFIQSLNAQLSNPNSALDDLLNKSDDEVVTNTMDLVGNLLSAITGGQGKILAARESDGTLAGFVSRSLVVPETNEQTNETQPTH